MSGAVETAGLAAPESLEPVLLWTPWGAAPAPQANAAPVFQTNASLSRPMSLTNKSASQAAALKASRAFSTGY